MIAHRWHRHETDPASTVNSCHANAAANACVLENGNIRLVSRSIAPPPGLTGTNPQRETLLEHCGVRAVGPIQPIQIHSCTPNL